MEKWVIDIADATIEKHTVVVSLQNDTKVIAYDILDTEMEVYDDFICATRCFDTFIDAKTALSQELQEEIQKLRVNLRLKKYQLATLRKQDASP